MIKICGEYWKLKENATEENFEEVTSWVTSLVTEIRTVLGLYFCTDFDYFQKNIICEFEGFVGCCEVIEDE